MLFFGQTLIISRQKGGTKMKKSLIMVRILFVLIGLSSLINQQVWADPHNGQSSKVVFIGGSCFEEGGYLLGQPSCLD